MRVEKKYTHRVVAILLLIGVFARTAYEAIREAWRTTTTCEAYEGDFASFIENNQPSFWEIVSNVPVSFLAATVLAIPIYICYLVSRRFFMASFVFKVYLLWYVLLGYALFADEKSIAYDNCGTGAAYIGFVTNDIIAAIAVPAVLVFLIVIETIVMNMTHEEDSNMDKK